MWSASRGEEVGYDGGPGKIEVASFPKRLTAGMVRYQVSIPETAVSHRPLRAPHFAQIGLAMDRAACCPQWAPLHATTPVWSGRRACAT